MCYTCYILKHIVIDLLCGTVDYICCLYGTPSAYGVVTMPFSVREGINIFLAGFVPTENLRFRDEELNFKLATNTGALLYKVHLLAAPFRADADYCLFAPQRPSRTPARPACTRTPR
jgi:hypothetical protein